MAYTKTNWVNGTTPLNDKNMNKIENELENLDTNISKSTDEYSSTRTYSIGELVIYNNKLYKANQDITTAEAFNSSHWTEVTLLSDVNEIKAVVNNNADNLNKMDKGIANKVDKVTGKGLSTNDFTNDYKKELDGLNFKIANYTLGNNIQIVNHQTKYNDHMLVVNEQIKTNAIINQYGELIILGNEISNFPNVLFVAVDSNGNTYQLQIYRGGRTCRLLSSNSIPSNVVLGFNCVIIK